MYSNFFSLRNGVRQGAVASAIFYCFYGNILFAKLRRSGLGCWLNGRYHGIFGYSDDNLLMAPSIFALQKMIDICEEFALSHNLKFSTDPDPNKCKTKCSAFPDIRLGGNTLPWVNKFKHLGHTLTTDSGITEQDILIKRAEFINKSMELSQEFYFASSRTKFRINGIYNSHFYGSPIWNMFGKSCKSLLASYNRFVRLTFELPLTTHRNLIEPITESRHLYITLLSRFLGFVKRVKCSNKVIPRLLLAHIQHDVRSITGYNLRKIMIESGKDDIRKLSKNDLSKVDYVKLPDEDSWKRNILTEMLDFRENGLDVDLTEDECMCIINFICTS